MRRTTIHDVAVLANVTPAAVSFALNGQPGVSEKTRQRILQIAREIDYRPNRAARSLSSGRADALGLIIDRPAQSIGTEPFFMQLIAGIQSRLSAPDAGIGLLLRIADDAEAEIAIYRDWWASGHVDGVFVVNVREDDPRWPIIESFGMPAVVLGEPEGTGLWSMSPDEEPFVTEMLTHLRELGHTNVARVSGPTYLRHSLVRTTAHEVIAERLGMRMRTVVGDYGKPDGAARTAELLAIADRPTAIIYDNDVMALAGLDTAGRLGVAVPDELSIVAWDDSMLCELVQPGITALHRDVVRLGESAASALISISRGHTPDEPYTETRPLVVRGSTGRAPAITTQHKEGRP
jgi:DNA-binding LacI/PurR family transcriptional regulator